MQPNKRILFGFQQILYSSDFLILNAFEFNSDVSFICCGTELEKRYKIYYLDQTIGLPGVLGGISALQEH